MVGAVGESALLSVIVKTGRVGCVAPAAMPKLVLAPWSLSEEQRGKDGVSVDIGYPHWGKSQGICMYVCMYVYIYKLQLEWFSYSQSYHSYLKTWATISTSVAKA